MWCQDLIQQSTFQPSYTSFKEPRLSFINILFRADWINVDSILPVTGDESVILDWSKHQNPMFRKLLQSSSLSIIKSFDNKVDDYYFIASSKKLERRKIFDWSSNF